MVLRAVFRNIIFENWRGGASWSRSGTVRCVTLQFRDKPLVDFIKFSPLQSIGKAVSRDCSHISVVIDRDTLIEKWEWRFSLDSMLRLGQTIRTGSDPLLMPRRCTEKMVETNWKLFLTHPAYHSAELARRRRLLSFLFFFLIVPVHVNVDYAPEMLTLKAKGLSTMEFRPRILHAWHLELSGDRIKAARIKNAERVLYLRIFITILCHFQ